MKKAGMQVSDDLYTASGIINHQVMKSVYSAYGMVTKYGGDRPKAYFNTKIKNGRNVVVLEIPEEYIEVELDKPTLVFLINILTESA